MSPHRFPRDFVFGVATSAYQIEGAWDADGKGPSIWDVFSQTPGRVHDDMPGDRGVDHYHRVDEDVALLRELGVDSYRLSLSWPRLLPDGAGHVNEKGVDFYDRLLDRLLEAGIDPTVTLYHWDLPQALEERGGWAARDVVDAFGEYSALAFDRYGDRVTRWATLNEPIAIWVGYALGVFAPGRTDRPAARQALHHAMLAHGTAVRAFRAAGSPGEIGIVLDIWPRHPATDSAEDRAAAVRGEVDGYRFFLDALFAGGYGDVVRTRLDADGTMPEVRAGDAELAAEPIDFLGLNVYSRTVVSAATESDRWWEGASEHPGGNYLASGLEFYPRALREAIDLVRDQYGVRLPLYITENGAAAEETVGPDGIVDAERIRYVDAFLHEAAAAIADGVDLRGYFLWTLLDNYEWAAGYSQKFGLVSVDPVTMDRTPKRSFHWYRDVIARRELP